MRIHLITGAATGIGAACARGMAGPGTGFIIHTRKNEAGAQAVAEAVRAAGGEAEVMLGDIGDPSLPAALVERAVARFGRLDVVVANAGFADKTPMLAVTEAGFARSLDTVLWAFLRLAQAAAPHLAGGRIVAVSSFVAHVYRANVTAFPTTAAAKSGVEALVRALSLELAGAGTTVNCVAPGFTRKDAAGHSAFTPEQWAQVTANIPMGRLGTPDDVAAAVGFLASERAGYITGQVLHVNGGLV